jgi:prolycopene isomerase
MEKMNTHYPLIIIGGGITGLSTAIAYAQTTRHKRAPVLLIEKNPVVGGAVTSFKRKGFLFDTAQLIPDPMELFEYFGIELPVKKFNNYFARIFLVNNGCAEKYLIPSGYDAFKEMLIDLFPAEKDAIRHFFSYSKTLFNELNYLKLEPNILDLIRIIAKCPKIVKNSKKTFHEYFQSFGFSNKKLEAIFDVFAAFSGMPTNRTIALMTIAAMNTSLNASYRPVKGFIQLPIALKRRAEELGCCVVTNTTAKKILIDHKKVKGVKLADDKIFHADYVVTTADTKYGMEQLVGMDNLSKINKKYAQKAKAVKMSASSVTISLGLDDAIDLDALGLDCGYNVITTGLGTFEKLFKAFDKGTYLLDKNNFHCAVICPSLTTGGKPAIIIRIVPMPMSNWKQLRDTDYQAYAKQKEAVADFYLDIVEQHLIPKLKQHIVYKDIATPATYERYLGSPTGSNYDMAPYPDNFGLKRLRTRTPVKGLFQPKFSHGIWPSMQAGLQVTDMITGGKVMKGYSKYRR